MQQAHFNAIANTYDTDFSNSKIGIMQRNRVWKNLLPHIKGGKVKSVLEINCGTGVDAYWLAKQGYQVVATDISEEMISCAANKQNNTANSNLNFMVCGFNDIATKLNGSTFDLIFSNFAGLNCVSKQELEKLNIDFASLLAPNGQLIMVLLGKYSWMEQLYFSLKGQYKKAKRRQTVDMVELSKGYIQPTYCYSVQETKNIFTFFECTAYKPIGIVIPPSYLEPLINKFLFVKPFIQFVEYLLGNISFFSNYADHTFLVFRKK